MPPPTTKKQPISARLVSSRVGGQQQYYAIFATETNTQLTLHRALPVSSEPAYEYGYSCDICGTDFATGPFYHCVVSGKDCCVSCRDLLVAKAQRASERSGTSSTPTAKRTKAQTQAQHQQLQKIIQCNVTPNSPSIDNILHSSVIVRPSGNTSISGVAVPAPNWQLDAPLLSSDRPAEQPKEEQQKQQRGSGPKSFSDPNALTIWDSDSFSFSGTSSAASLPPSTPREGQPTNANANRRKKAEQKPRMQCSGPGARQTANGGGVAKRGRNAMVLAKSETKKEDEDEEKSETEETKVEETARRKRGIPVLQHTATATMCDFKAPTSVIKSPPIRLPNGESVTLSWSNKGILMEGGTTTSAAIAAQKQPRQTSSSSSSSYIPLRSLRYSCIPPGAVAKILFPTTAEHFLQHKIAFGYQIERGVLCLLLRNGDSIIAANVSNDQQCKDDDDDDGKTRKTERKCERCCYLYWYVKSANRYTQVHLQMLQHTKYVGVDSPLRRVVTPATKARLVVTPITPLEFREHFGFFVDFFNAHGDEQQTEYATKQQLEEKRHDPLAGIFDVIALREKQEQDYGERSSSQFCTSNSSTPAHHDIRSSGPIYDAKTKELDRLPNFIACSNVCDESEWVTGLSMEQDFGGTIVIGLACGTVQLVHFGDNRELVLQPAAAASVTSPKRTARETNANSIANDASSSSSSPKIERVVVSVTDRNLGIAGDDDDNDDDELVVASSSPFNIDEIFTPKQQKSRSAGGRTTPTTTTTTTRNKKSRTKKASQREEERSTSQSGPGFFSVRRLVALEELGTLYETLKEADRRQQQQQQQSQEERRVSQASNSFGTPRSKSGNRRPNDEASSVLGTPVFHARERHKGLCGVMQAAWNY